MLGKKMRNLWNLKRKGVENENLEKKTKNLRVNKVDLKLGKGGRGWRI